MPIPRSGRYFAAFAILVCIQALNGCRSTRSREAPPPADSRETIVMIRHGEKPAAGLGQISCKGLNRALALPDLLIGRYGKPDFLYAPNPSLQVNDHGGLYSYVRPLASIEPTAIRAGLPVNTQIGYRQIEQLQAALTQPAYANSRVFVAWEHGYLHAFAQQLLRSYGDDPSVIPPWSSNDYDTKVWTTRCAMTAHRVEPTEPGRSRSASSPLHRGKTCFQSACTWRDRPDARSRSGRCAALQ
jgi:hypothetical protein